jgi:hypothetical protein
MVGAKGAPLHSTEEAARLLVPVEYTLLLLGTSLRLTAAAWATSLVEALS